MSTSNPLTADAVRKVAVLARLKLSDSQIDLFTEQLGDVLQYVRLLDEVDVEGVEPMAHAVEVTNALRDDIPTPSLDREAALQNAPQTDGKTFRVPAVFGGE